MRRKPPYRSRRNRRGGTIILTMVFLALFATLAVAFSAGSNMNLQQAKNYRDGQLAQMAGESGLAYMVQTLGGLSIPVDEAEENILVAAANHLAQAMDGTPNMGFGEITFDGVTVRTPTISLDDDGKAFRAEIIENANGEIWLNVYGTWGSFTRHVAMRMAKVTDESIIFDFGIASKGKITVGGDGSVVGVNGPSEASIFSATYSDPEAVEVGGSSNVAGDIYTANPSSFVTIKGKASVAGSSDLAEIVNHIHIGVGDPAFPEVDTSIYTPFAYNVLDSNADTSADMVLENIRIPAGMNPTFAGHVTVRGVVHIEQPNDVKFTGNASITGVIVTDDPGDNAYDNNMLTFTGSVTSAGVEALPDLPQFVELKKLPGSMLLAPGFGVKFTGNFDALNGAIAAEKFTITGSASGIVHGPIICYGDTEFELWGSSKVRIDRSTYGSTPPGFKLPYTFAPISTTYREVR